MASVPARGSAPTSLFATTRLVLPYYLALKNLQKPLRVNTQESAVDRGSSRIALPGK